jgi:hypothetical protein
VAAAAQAERRVEKLVTNRAPRRVVDQFQGFSAAAALRKLVLVGHCRF